MILRSKYYIKLGFSVLALVILTLCANPALCASYDQEEQNLIDAAELMRLSGRVQLNFKDIDVVKFLRFMSEVLGENIVIDPNITGTISVTSPKPVGLKEARQVMLTVLEMNNLTIEQMDGYSKITPATGAGITSSNVIKGNQSVSPGETVLTQVVPLDYVNANYVMGPLKLAVKDVQVSPVGDGRAVMIVGKATVLNRAANVIRALDSPDSIQVVRIVELTHASPKLIESQINSMGKDASSRLAGITAMADERTKSVVLIGRGVVLNDAEKIIKGLDIPTKSESFHVYKLHNSDAATIAEQLSKMLSAASKISPDADGSVPTTVVPDLPTNSLIFTATQEQYASIVQVLEQLDTQPKQVMIRGLIAEVSLNKLNSAGIDWAAWGGDIVGDAVVAGNIQLGSTSVPSDVQSLYQSLITQESYHETSSGAAVSTTETQGAGLMYAYVRLLNKFDAINVLSMPRIMCTDNLPSSLQVGQVIPQLTGSMTNQTSSGAITNSYEYKDVGLILNVTPHIRSGNLVSLEIEQRIEELQTTTNNSTPITSKREVKTSVLVNNGQTVIIGGLIREAEKELKNRVPFFSYIPLVGNLFKTTEKQREKVDLMIFLTPYIIETPEHASAVTDTIIKDGQQLSEAEKTLIQRNNSDYQKATKNQGVTREMLDPKGLIYAPQKNDKPEAEDLELTEAERAWVTEQKQPAKTVTLKTNTTAGKTATDAQAQTQAATETKAEETTTAGNSSDTATSTATGAKSKQDWRIRYNQMVAEMQAKEANTASNSK